MSDNKFVVGGLARLSTCDWPDHIVATVFAQGCPWSCVYCHNPDLIDPRAKGEMPWETVMNFLSRRQGLLDGVVFSGGEPTRQKELVDAIADVTNLGFKVGMHTMGAYPTRLRTILDIGSVDWIGLDVKAPWSSYEKVTGAASPVRKVVDSLRMIMSSGVGYEVRTTVHPSIFTPEELDSMAAMLLDEGITKWVVQKARSEGSLYNFDWKDNSLIDAVKSSCDERGLELLIRGE